MIYLNYLFTYIGGFVFFIKKKNIFKKYIEKLAYYLYTRSQLKIYDIIVFPRKQTCNIVRYFCYNYLSFARYCLLFLVVFRYLKLVIVS